MPHGLPRNALQKSKKKISKKIPWAAVTADQVQDGLGHGEIEQGEKKKEDFLLNCFCTTLAVVFSFGGSKT